MNGEVLFRQKFSDHNFCTSSLDDMSIYLNHTNQNEREYPFTFISKFQRNELENFYDDCLDWFAQYGSS